MSCKSCHSTKQRHFPAEINVHFPGYQNLTTPTVWLFPNLVICLDCGFSEFRIGGTELRQLRAPDVPAKQLRASVA